MSAETETPGATVAAAEKPAGSGKEAEDAYNHLMQGKRHLLVKDYPSAVASLADACALLAGKVGDLAPELGEFYLFYGKSLLELARAEAGVIDMAPPKSDSDEEEDDDDEDKDSKDDEDKDSKEDKEESESKEDSDEASKSGEDEAAKDGEEEKTDTEKSGEEEVVKNGDEKTENGPGTSNGAGPSKSADDGEEVEDEKDEDEVNNLQLAWEILEMAKIIFQKQADESSSSKETKIKLSEVLLKLGEVGIESENWPTAIDDLKACLSIQEEVLDADDRRLAETHYHLAIAHSNNNEYQESIDAYEKACNQLQVRIDALEAKRPKEDMINQTLIDSEIKELKDLLVEMKERLNDTKAEKDEPTPKEEQDEIVKNGSEAKPVSNIAHLVRKKPKAEASDAAAETKTEVKADTVDKTQGGSNVEERKRKSEDDDSASLAALKKAKVLAES